MASLIPLTPCAGLLPAEIGGVRLEEVVPEAITSVAPLKGQEKAVSAALKEALGAGLPGPNRTVGKEGARVIWAGRGQAFLLGPPVAPEGAAVTDQSDAWAVIRIEGKAAEAVLARLTPLDLRASAFKRGHTARTLLNHMTCSLTRLGAQSFEIMVFRSMARTAVHELTEAMDAVAARSSDT